MGNILIAIGIVIGLPCLVLAAFVVAGALMSPREIVDHDSGALE